VKVYKKTVHSKVIKSNNCMDKINVLFVSQSYGKDSNEMTQCGIGIRGKLISDTLTNSKKYNFIQVFTDNYDVVQTYIESHNPKVIFYNYSAISTPWVNDTYLRQAYPHIVHIMIHYDMHQQLIDNYSPEQYHMFQYIITDDITLQGTDHVFVVPRCLPKVATENDAEKRGGPVKIGFQGFSQAHKGIHRVAEQVQAEYDEAIINLHIPFSLFGDPDGSMAYQRVAEVKSIITKPGIIVQASHNFMKDNEIVNWLHQNDINCYFYDYLDGCGIASSPDYALAARKPIAVTRSHQMRHFWNLEPTVLIEQSSLRQIIANGIAPLQKLYEDNTPDKLIEAYEQIVAKFVE
jgi:hypothetical protein